MSFCSGRKLLMQIPSKSQTQTKVHFVLNLTAPSYYFKITGSENTKITGVISEKINCSMCNCRLIACPLPSEARAIVYSLSHDERPSVVVQGTYLNLYFANGTTASRVTMTRSMLVGAKKFFARQSRIRKQGQTGNTLTGNACRDVCACHAVTSFLDNLAQDLHISDFSIRLVLEDD